MLLRKINAGVSLIIAFLLLDHAIFNAARMISRGTIEKNGGFLFHKYGIFLYFCMFNEII